jgi:hypothetical protein
MPWNLISVRIQILLHVSTPDDCGFACEAAYRHAHLNSLEFRTEPIERMIVTPPCCLFLREHQILINNVARKERTIHASKRVAHLIFGRNQVKRHNLQKSTVALIGFETLFNGKAYTEEGCNAVSSRA